MQDAQFGHWGGANDGVVREPIHWETLLLLDKPKRDTACQSEA